MPAFDFTHDLHLIIKGPDSGPELRSTMAWALQLISISSPGFVKLRIRFNSTQSLRASLQLIPALCVPNTRGLSGACMLCIMHVYRRQR